MYLHSNQYNLSSNYTYPFSIISTYTVLKSKHLKNYVELLDYDI